MQNQPLGVSPRFPRVTGTLMQLGSAGASPSRVAYTTVAAGAMGNPPLVVEAATNRAA